LEYKNLCYLISISFQISGAFLLAYMGFTKKVKNIAEEVVGFTLMGRDIENIPIPQVAGKLLEIYLTRIGFTLVFFGYVFSIFGERELKSPMAELLQITVISLVISSISLLLSYILVKRRKGKIEKECKSNLPAGTLFLEEID
jgi:hypothetical protein